MNLQRKHSILKTCFKEIDGRIYQYIDNANSVDFKVKNTNRRDIDKEITNFVKPFNLNKAPLWRAELLKLGEQEHILVLVFIIVLLTDYQLIYS